MNRIEIEIKLNRDRAWLLETVAGLDRELLYRAATPSEHDATKSWSIADHFVHTTLIERNWNAMFRRHIAGGQGMERSFNPEMTAEERAAVMSGIHKWTEDWADQHRAKPVDELVRVGLEVRADTLKLLSELSDEQLASVIPGTPWADHTVGGIMAANADHGRMHYKWAKDGLATQGIDVP